jgi:RNAse (barnase) inhibitor barstar
MPGWFDVHAAIPGLRGRSVHVVGADREQTITEALLKAGLEVRVLDGAWIRDEGSLFTALVPALGLPSTFGANWDALNDALSELTEGPARGLAVLWRDADRSLQADPQLLLDAVVAFSAAGSAGTEETAQLELFLLFGRRS